MAQECPSVLDELIYINTHLENGATKRALFIPTRTESGDYVSINRQEHGPAAKAGNGKKRSEYTHFFSVLNNQHTTAPITKHSQDNTSIQSFLLLIFPNPTIWISITLCSLSKSSLHTPSLLKARFSIIYSNFFLGIYIRG